MRGSLLAVSFGVASVAILGAYALHGGTIRVLPNHPKPDGTTLLPNGWNVTPAGTALDLPGDMPIKMAFTPDGSKLMVVTGGYHDQGVSIINPQTLAVIQTVGLGNAWAGLTLDANDAFVSGGGMSIHRLQLGSTITRAGEISAFASKSSGTGKLAKRTPVRYIGGLLHTEGSLWAVSIGTNAIIELSGSPLQPVAEVSVGYRPYSIVLSPDHKEAAVSNWGDRSVSFLDLTAKRETGRVNVGSHPNEMVWGADGRLFVANSGSNDVSVLKDHKVIETIKTSLSPSDLVGSTPDALALAPDGKTLFVANADNNDVAVIDVSHETSVVRGFIPTGWYPSAIAISPDGKKLFVGTGKGLKFAANAPAATRYTRTEYDGKRTYDYIGGVLSGHVNVVDVPSPSQLVAYTKVVARNMPHPTSGGMSEHAIDDITKNVLRKIKHVVYIIRENRTYDQVFGDLPKGNNDPNLVLFGKDVTPNAHALTQEFVQFDNLYCNGEVSEDGHQWCDSAYCTDFTEKGWVNSYAGRSEPDADDRLTASPAGYLWDNCRTHGVSYFSYGEVSSFTSDPNSPPRFTGQKGLEGHASLAWFEYQKNGGFGRDYQKVQVFINDMKKAEESGEWPAFMVMSLGEDHTSGLKTGAATPQASVASNDLGLAKMIDSVSHSKFWKDTAFFIIEDDAQNGPDHVDAHRTVGLIISPYIRRGTLDSTQYTTASFVRTMELILGLPPMTQFDGRATPVIAPFSKRPDLRPYSALPEIVDLQAVNRRDDSLAAESNRLNWSEYDRANPDVLNRILWKAIRPNSPVPAPTRSSHVVR